MLRHHFIRAQRWMLWVLWFKQRSWLPFVDFSPPQKSMNHNTSPPEICLLSLLRDGPRNSREVLAAMSAQQFTPKQVRRARERQGVLIERSGNGADMHSTWRLPGNTAAVAAGVGDTPRTSDAPVAQRTTPAHIEGDRRRHLARVDAFMLRGMSASTARQVADALMERDSTGLRAVGSCAECQCVDLESCPATPRPVIEIHECWCRRQCTP